VEPNLPPFDLFDSPLFDFSLNPFRDNVDLFAFQVADLSHMSLGSPDMSADDDFEVSGDEKKTGMKHKRDMIVDHYMSHMTNSDGWMIRSGTTRQLSTPSPFLSPPSTLFYFHPRNPALMSDCPISLEKGGDCTEITNYCQLSHLEPCCLLLVFVVCCLVGKSDVSHLHFMITLLILSVLRFGSRDSVSTIVPDRMSNSV
jgi:hypothetical protein